MKTICDVVLVHYSLLDGMTSDWMCVCRSAPWCMEHGVWKWGFTTINCLMEHIGAHGCCAGLGDSPERVVGERKAHYASRMYKNTIMRPCVLPCVTNGNQG